jgi:AraC-like DNA-binding protein
VVGAKLVFRQEQRALKGLLEDAQIIGEETVELNEYAEARLVQLTGARQAREEDAMLCCYPVSDRHYMIELVYLGQPSNEDLTEYTAVRFSPPFFSLFGRSLLQQHMPFRLDHTAEIPFFTCGNSRALIASLRAPAGLTPLVQSLQLTEVALQLLRRAVEAVTMPFTVCPVPACRFLAHDTEREKIFKARAILDAATDGPMTIKDLSRKVAMNECYLKKGFKTLVGKSINEYQQDLRIERAKEMLSKSSRSVTEVAALLGYSSISHFSTAFKKATGLKPCELLG